MGEKKRIIEKIVSVKKAIEEHLKKLEEDLKNNDRRYTFYYFKEILRSMFPSLQELYKKLNNNAQGEAAIKELQDKLEKILKANGCFDEYKEIYFKRFEGYP